MLSARARNTGRHGISQANRNDSVPTGRGMRRIHNTRNSRSTLRRNFARVAASAASMPYCAR